MISLDQLVHDYGGARRRLRIAKMRGIKFREGFHDFTLETGGIDVYPRLVAAEHHAEFSQTRRSARARRASTPCSAAA